MKKIVIILLLLTTGFILYPKAGSEFEREYESLNNEARSINIPTKNNVIMSSMDEVISKYNVGDDFLVYFGFNSCPWCRSIVNILIDAASNNGNKPIYYVDVKNVRDKYELVENKLVKTVDGTKEYYKILKILNNELDDYIVNSINTNEKRLYAPTIVAFKDKKVVGLTSGISDFQDDSNMKITKKIYDDSYNKITNVISKLNSCNYESKC